MRGDEIIEKPGSDYINKKLAEARVQYQRQEYFPALKILEALASVDDEDPEVLFPLANCLRKLNRLEEAVKYYNHVILLKPNHYRARNNLATTYVLMRKTEDARGQLEKALKIQGDYKAARINIERLQKMHSLN